MGRPYRVARLWSGGDRVSTLTISEAGTVQFPMVKHAVEIGWTPLTPEAAEALMTSGIPGSDDATPSWDSAVSPRV